MRLWILQMPVASVNAEQEPCVDSGIQVDERSDTGLDMDGACPPELLQFDDCGSGFREGKNTSREQEGAGNALQRHDGSRRHQHDQDPAGPVAGGKFDRIAGHLPAMRGQPDVADPVKQ